MSIKAIETVFDGHRFRSRLEARWATFFNGIGVTYEYETEGYDLDGLWYLPDFWLPKLDAWIEVKGIPVVEGDDTWEKAYRLAEAFEHPVYVFSGQFPKTPGDLTGMEFSPYTRGLPEDMIGPPDHVWWFQCPLCLAYQIGRQIWDLPCECLLASPNDNASVVSAVIAARQARFERGGK